MVLYTYISFHIYLGLMYHISKNPSLGLALSTLGNILALVVHYLALVVNFAFGLLGLNLVCFIHQPELNSFVTY